MLPSLIIFITLSLSPHICVSLCHFFSLYEPLSLSPSLSSTPIYFNNMKYKYVISLESNWRVNLSISQSLTGSWSFIIYLPLLSCPSSDNFSPSKSCGSGVRITRFGSEPSGNLDPDPTLHKSRIRHQYDPSDKISDPKMVPHESLMPMIRA